MVEMQAVMQFQWLEQTETGETRMKASPRQILVYSEVSRINDR